MVEKWIKRIGKSFFLQERTGIYIYLYIYMYIEMMLSKKVRRVLHMKGKEFCAKVLASQNVTRPATSFTSESWRKVYF